MASRKLELLVPEEEQKAKKKKAEIYHPSNVEQIRLSQLKDALGAYKYPGPGHERTAKTKHLDALRKKHGATWTRVRKGKIYPSIQQIYQDSLWYSSVENLWSLPTELLPDCVLLEENKKNKTTGPTKERDPSKFCKGCARKLAVPGVIRCEDCQWMCLEKVWFAFHPTSQYTGFDGNKAIALIDQALHENWNVYKLSAMLEGDHATDDDDPTKPYNRKTGMYTTFQRRNHEDRLAGCRRRFQEALNGLIKFLCKNGHGIITYDEDNRNTAELKKLRASRDEKTKAYVATLDVTDLLEFTKAIRDETQGGYNFDLRQFLFFVRPYWVAKVVDMSPKESVEFTAAYTKGKAYGAPKA